MSAEDDGTSASDKDKIIDVLKELLDIGGDGRTEKDRDDPATEGE